jgi:hypothetical protein
MASQIRILAQCYDNDSGDILEEVVINDTQVQKAKTLRDLGYLHKDQIEILQKAQDLKLKHQLMLATPEKCQKCGNKMSKRGMFGTKFHAVLTDHKVKLQYMRCKCGWASPCSIEGLFGSSLHPELMEKQAIQGSQESYERASKSLDANSAKKRSINSHSQIYKSVKLVSEPLEKIRIKLTTVEDKYSASSLIANIDGGHIKSRGVARSFEAMIATVYSPENIKKVDKHHNSITKKSTVASAKSDDHQTMNALFKSACETQGMNKNTEITCLADGAENCRSIAYSVDGYCKKITYILDWFHIAMKFKNYSSAIPEEHKELYDNVKWNLWHGNVDKSLKRIDELKAFIDDKSMIAKLKKLYVYIDNNKAGIVDYELRKSSGLVFTSNLAESTVNTLINQRQKGKQKMLWSRVGAHSILQIRAALQSKSWKNLWTQVENIMYHQVA